MTIFALLGLVNWPGSIELRAAVAITVFLLAAIVVMAICLICTTILNLARERRRLKQQPSINETLAAEVVTGGQIEQLKRFARKCPIILAECIRAELSCIAGRTHRHISQLACDLGLVQHWTCQLRSRRPLRRSRAVRLLGALDLTTARSMLVGALNDDSEQVRIEAGRALVRWGDAEAIEAVLTFATSQPLLLRALVAEDLRHVMASCERYLPKLLWDDDPTITAGALDIITAWQKTLRIPHFEALLQHSTAGVRLRALRLAPYITDRHDLLGDAVIAALFDPNREIRAAAATAAGAMGLTKSIPRLHSLLQAADERVSLNAAWALSRLGDKGLTALEAEILGGSPCAAFALEALERSQLGLELYDAA
ncbi:MAG: HEAT repeat domain-containing protein [Deltaproteobacteria bacterium]|nr:HEAT repeat domain-containing protein [Deltaproteobacteria bacterium]